MRDDGGDGDDDAVHLGSFLISLTIFCSMLERSLACKINLRLLLLYHNVDRDDEDSIYHNLCKLLMLVVLLNMMKIGTYQ